MKKTTQQKIEMFRKQLEITESICDDIIEILDFLPYCEWDLISFMISNNLWIGAKPTPPPGPRPEHTSVDFGLFPYWINNPDLITNATVKRDVIKYHKFLTTLVPSQMTLENYKRLTITDKSKIIIYSDGSVLNTEAYATYDQGWFAAFYNLLQTVLGDNWYNKGTFPMPPVLPSKIPLSGSTANKVTIAMMGDWGAGNRSALA